MATETMLDIALRKLRDYKGGAVLSDAESAALLAELEQAERDIAGYRRALVAHHEIATLSDEVMREYDWRECPVCKKARS